MSKLKSNEILGETGADLNAAQFAASDKKWMPKDVKVGDVVTFTVNGSLAGEVCTYPALVTVVKNRVNASIVVFRESFTEHLRNVPQAEENTAGYFKVKS